MKLKNILTEQPIPDDWDSEIFDPRESFAKQIRYATARAEKLGAGSSRVAFKIDFNGRKTALKIAKNKKGLAQNEFEAQMLMDSYVEDLSITIPIIDYDEVNDPPRWIHTEFAEKMKPSQFKQFFGINHKNIKTAIDFLVGQGPSSNLPPEAQERYQQLYEDNEYIVSLADLVGNYNITMGDFVTLSNWGIYKGRPVIIDIGLSTEVFNLHYSR